MSLPTVVHVAPAALCVLAWVGAGAVLPSRLLPGDELLRWVTRTGAGALACATALWVVGLAGGFDRTFIVAATVVLGAVGAATAVRERPRLRLPEARAARVLVTTCLLYTSPSPRDLSTSRMPSSA